VRKTRSTRLVRLLAGVTVAAVAGLILAAPVAGQEPAAGSRRPDVIYVPTPQDVVDAMLDMAKVTKNDIVYDLGCGDGRIVITAAKLGARGVGIDIDPQRIKEARENAKTAGVEDRVQFLEADLFATDISKATVVTLYLLPSLNLKLQPKLFKELKPGTRIVSHAFDMGDWKPEQTREVEWRTIYFWTIPANRGK
jgi:SAM-dependent methyltransferase